jgi:NAD(P)-dependent dehydrogenase (short-subunit alcohol dehydrogenase family)
VTDEDFQKVILTNVTSVFVFFQGGVKCMLEKKNGGVIINISSMAAQYGLPKVIGYSASKNAIDGMTRAMAVELASKGIRWCERDRAGIYLQTCDDGKSL